MPTAEPSLPRFLKSPAENLRRTFNLAPSLPDGAVLTNPSVLATRLQRIATADAITPTNEAVSGGAVQANFPGGTDEEDYLITIGADVSTGGTIVEYFVLQCRDGIAVV